MVFRCSCGNCSIRLLQNASECCCRQHMEKCMEALSDEWVLQDLETAPKSYSKRSCGNCLITFRQNGNECSCCQEMEKCAQSLSDEWVLQSLEAPKCITSHPAFNTVCLDRWSLRLALGSTGLLIKKVISKLVQKRCKLQKNFPFL